jgi:hypothetical protein
MAYRLKNSDFRLFLGVLDEKVMNWWVCAGEGIGVYFGVFSSGKSVPRDGSRSVKKLFINRLRRIKSSSVGCQ